MVEVKSNTSKTELKTMRSKIYYTRMSVTANKTGRRNEICLSRKIRRLKNRFEEMKSTRRECTLYYGEKAATK